MHGEGELYVLEDGEEGMRLKNWKIKPKWCTRAIMVPLSGQRYRLCGHEPGIDPGDQRA